MSGLFDDVLPPAPAAPAAVPAAPGLFDDVLKPTKAEAAAEEAANLPAKLAAQAKEQGVKLDTTAPVGSPGFTGGLVDFGRGLARGAISGLPKAAGDTAEFLFDRPDIGKPMQEFGDRVLEENPNLKPSQVEQLARQDWTSLRGAAGQAGENTPLSMGPGLAGAAGGAAIGAALGGGVGALPGAAVGYIVGSLAGMPLFYGQQGKQSSDTVKERLEASNKAGTTNYTPEEIASRAHTAGMISGGIEVGGEMAADLIPFSKLLKPFTVGAKGALVAGIFSPKQQIKRAALTAAEIQAAEISTEMGQQAGESQVEGMYGGGKGATWEDTASVILPTALMTLLPAGFTTAHNFRSTQVLKHTLTNPEADPEARAAAAAVVFHGIKDEDPGVAQAFDLYSAHQIAEDAPIKIGDDQTYLKYYEDFAAKLGRGANPNNLPVTPQLVGINPQGGPTQAVAAVAMTGGATAQAAQARAAPIEAANAAAETEKAKVENPELSDAEIAAKLAKETFGDTQAIDEETETPPATAPLPAMVAFPTEEAARRVAAGMTTRSGEPYVVIPHPTNHTAFAAVPQKDADRIQAQQQAQPIAPAPPPSEVKPTTPETKPAVSEPKAAETKTPAAPATDADLEAAFNEAAAEVKKEKADAAKEPSTTKVGAQPGGNEGVGGAGEGGRVGSINPEKAPGTPAPETSGERPAVGEPAAKSPEAGQVTHAIKVEQVTSGTAKGQFQATVQAGPHAGVVGFGNDEAQARREVLRVIGQRNAAAAALPQPEHPTDVAAHDAATSPTNGLTEPSQPQAIAGNYQKGHIKIGPMDISVENPEGSVRSDKNNVPPRWSQPIAKAHYGYIKGTIGKDKDHIDAFVKPGTEATHDGPVFVIDQPDITGGFDEHKVMVGYGSKLEAISAYKANYPKGHVVGLVSETTAAEFNAWAKNPAATKLPFSERAGAEDKRYAAIPPVDNSGYPHSNALEYINRTFMPNDRLKVIRRQMGGFALQEDGYILGSLPNANKDSDFTIPNIKTWVAAAEAKAAQQRPLSPKGPTHNEQLESARAEARRAMDKAIEKIQQANVPNLLSAFEYARDRIGDQEHSFAPGAAKVLAGRVDKLIEEAKLKPNEYYNFLPRKPESADARKERLRKEEEAKKAAAKAEKQKGKAKAQAVRTVQAELFKALNGNARLIAVANESKEKFEAEVIDLAADWLRAQRASADEIRAHGLDEARAKILEMAEHLQKAAQKIAKKAAAEKAEADRVAGERAKKLKNTGVDLRRFWEQLRADAKADRDKTGITAANSIFAKTARGDLFNSVIGTDLTPGAKDFVNQLRQAVMPFKEWVVNRRESKLAKYKLSGTYDESITDIIYGFVSGKFDLRGKQALDGFTGILPEETIRTEGWDPSSVPTSERVTLLANMAEEYTDGVQRFLEPFRGVKTLDDFSQALTQFFTKPKQSGYRAQTTDFTALGKSLYDAGIIDHDWMYARGQRIYPESDYLTHLKKTENDVTTTSRKLPMIPPRLDAITRKGLPDVRKGDVTGEEMKQQFGFADIGFGDWVLAKEDQAHLNLAYDAFADLARFLGINPRAIGNGGQMHFLIGALGHGKYAATFHPQQPHPNGGSVEAINVTKTKGDGTVAHEWGHALDHFLSATDAGREVMKEIARTLRTKYDVEAMRQHAISGLKGHSWMTNLGKRSLTTTEGLIRNAEAILDYHMGRGKATTEYKRHADAMDPKYWGNDAEMFARAWEAWVSDNLGGTNDYLVNPLWVGEGLTAPPRYKGTPYPMGAERVEFGKWMSALRASLRTEGGTLTVDRAAWDANKPKTAEEFRNAVDAMKAELPEMLQQIRFEKQAKEKAKAAEAQAKREAEERAAEQARIAAEEAAAREAAADNPPPAETPTGPLTRDDLEAIWQDASDAINNETAEDATTLAPGEAALLNTVAEPVPPKVEEAPPLPANVDGYTVDDLATLRKLVEDGKIVFTGGNQIGFPAFQTIPNLRHLGMGVFNAKTAEYDITVDGGGAMDRLPSGKAYTVAQVTGVYPYDKAAALAALDKAQGQLTPDARPEANPKASALIAEAAKQGVKGIDEALTALTKLFGSGKIQSFPGGFDKDAYAAAKPHLEASLAAFQAAGKSLKDLFKLLIQQFGEGFKPYAMAFAEEKQLTANLGSQTNPTKELADWVAAELDAGRTIPWMRLFELANQFYGGTQAEGKFTPKDAYDAAEAGMNIHMMRFLGGKGFSPDQSAADATIALKVLGAHTDLLPTQTKRTQEQDEYQQFSTVPGLAFMANWVANITPGELYGEPSAGIGGLAVFGKLAGARIVANEFSSRRAEVLRMVLPDAQVFTEDGIQIANILSDETRPTVIVMNPPFSSTAGRIQGQRDTMNGAAHIEAALQWLKPGGRLVAIVGNGMAADRPAFKEWWGRIKQQYDVKAILELSGKEYAKYGTQFDNALIVIDKAGPTTKDIVTGRVEAYSELPALLEGVRNERVRPNEGDRTTEQSADQPVGGETVAPGVEQPGGAERPLSGNVESGGPTANVGTGTGPVVVGGRPGTGNEVGHGDAGGGRDTGPGRSGRTDEGGSVGPDLGVVGGQDGLVEFAATDGRRNRELTDAIFDDYEVSKAVVKGSRPHPGKLVESAAMAAVEPVDATYVPHLPQDVIVGRPDVPSFGLSAPQIEAVIYAGQSHQTFLPPDPKGVEYRRAYFIGDGTGVGKGREIGGIILDNMRQGRKKAVWISASAGLIKSAQRDWMGVGGSADDIFGLRDAANGGARPDGDLTRKEGITFLTYDTLKGGEKVQPGGANSTIKKGARVVVANPMGPNNGTAKLVSINAKSSTVVVEQNNRKTTHPFAQILSIGGRSDWQTALKAAQDSRQTTIKQLVKWVGEDFDGVIAFDESHLIKNLGGQRGARGTTKPAERAVVAASLREKLPKARIVFVSATGATEVANLGYMERLGLWGANTAFGSANDFFAKITAAGLATMELIARDMKALGLYISRSLSFDGVEQEAVDSSFTPLQKEIYDELALAWQIIVKNVHKALEDSEQNKNGQAKGAAMSALWSTQQRFFNQVITAMMTPTVMDRARREVEAGNAIVFQLVNTNEATQERLIEKAEAEDTALEELDFSPKQGLIEYLLKSFPVTQFEEYTDANGNTSSRPVMDSNGNYVENKDLVAQRDALIKHIEDDLRVPDNPIDLIYNAFGEENVGEVSGRGRRFQRVMHKDGTFTLEERKRGSKSNEADAQAFMDDKKKVLIFTDAGGTGYSFDSDRTAINQRRRIHIILQPGWIAEKAVQGIGRTHRSNEANQPMVLLPKSDLKAQKRFISSIARRLDQLGALTKGQRNTTSQGLFKASDNLESRYALAALRQVIEDMEPAGSVVPDARVLIDAMGLNDIYDPLTGRLIEGKMPTIQRFLNRLLSLTVAQQDAVFGEFETRMEAAVQTAIENGTFDDGMQTVKALHTNKTRDEVIYTDPASGSTTHYVELELTKPSVLNDWQTLQAQLGIHPGKGVAYYIDNQTGQPFAMVDQGERTDADGRPQSRGYRFNVRAPSLASRGVFVTNRSNIEKGGTAHIFRQEDEQGRKFEKRGARYQKISPDVAEYLWAEAYESAPKTFTDPLHMLSGILLPVWDRVQVGSSDRTQAVVRVQTDQGERLIGRVVHPDNRGELLKRFGLGSIRSDMPAKAIIDRVMAGDIAQLANGWIIKKVQLSGEPRMEIQMVTYSPADFEILKSQGAFVERIGYKERAFIPTGAKQEQVFEAVTRGGNRPVVDILTPNAGPKASILPQIQGLPTRGMGVSAVRAAVANIKRAWRNAPIIQVVQSAAQLDFKIAGDVYGRVRGAYHQGVIYLVADNLKSEADVAFVLLHETVGHFGIARTLGHGLEGIMAKIYRDSPEVRMLADAKIAEFEYDQALATEEALSDLAGLGRIQDLPMWKMLVAAIRKALRDLGFDVHFSENDIAALLAASRRYVEGMEPAGAIELTRVEPVYSVATLQDRATQYVQDHYLRSPNTFNAILKPFQTQYHKAQTNPYFRRVFIAAQAYIRDVAAFANDAADLAGDDLLPRLGNVKDVFKNITPGRVRALRADTAMASQAMMLGTLGNARLTDAELRSGINIVTPTHGILKTPKLTEPQIEIFHKARAAIDLSLRQIIVSEMARLVRSDILNDDAIEAAKADPFNGASILLAEVNRASAEAAAAGDMKAVAKFDNRVEEINALEAQYKKLYDQGYAPLMRFGQYSVRIARFVNGKAEEELFFGLYESKAEMYQAERDLREDPEFQKPNVQIITGTMDEDQWKLYRGLSLDSLAVFAHATGLDEDEAFQAFYKLALSSRSAMKRLIHRKGIAGYSEDLPRILAGFITSNARLAARNYHAGEMAAAATEIPNELGQLRTEAARLVSYVQNPMEEAHAARGLLFVHFIGGSIASALVNMTQPFMMSAPYLSQFTNPVEGYAALARAARALASGNMLPATRAALTKAGAEGVTDPQELHQLYAESIRGLGSNIWWRKGLRVWGAPFSLAETFNRRLTFIAAFDIASKPGAMDAINAKRQAAGKPTFADAFDFAERAVEDTQGVYNRANRPNISRGPVGAIAFTFKQYTVAYLEFLSRLPRREQLMAGALLIAAAGLQGAPGADNLEDLIDTIGQWLGFNTNSKRALREWAYKYLGQTAGPMLIHGLSGIPGVPIDVSGRLAINNLIPGTNLFKRSDQDKSQAVAEFFGPAGGVYNQISRGVNAAQAGNWKAAAMSSAPIAVGNAMKALDMWQTGMARDSMGRKIINTTGFDAAVKSLGIQPKDVALAAETATAVRQDVAMVRLVESEIADKWARAIINKDPDGVKKAVLELFNWNRSNPQWIIRIEPRQIQQRIQAAMMERGRRLVKSAPAEVRGVVLGELR